MNSLGTVCLGFSEPLQYDKLISISPTVLTDLRCSAPTISFKMTEEEEAYKNDYEIVFEIKTEARTISTSFHYPESGSTVRCFTPHVNMRYAVIHKNDNEQFFLFISDIPDYYCFCIDSRGVKEIYHHHGEHYNWRWNNTL